MSVNRAKEEIFSSQFVQWIEYLDRKEEEHEKWEYYLAEITAALYKAIVKNPENIKAKDHLLKSRVVYRNDEPAIKDPKMRAEISKQVWLGFAMSGKINNPKIKEKENGSNT